MKPAITIVAIFFVMLSSLVAQAKCFSVYAVSAGEEGTVDPTYFKLVGPKGTIIAEAKIKKGVVMPVVERATQISVDADKALTANVELAPGSTYSAKIRFADGDNARFDIAVTTWGAQVSIDPLTSVTYGVNSCK